MSSTEPTLSTITMIAGRAAHVACGKGHSGARTFYPVDRKDTVFACQGCGNFVDRATLARRQSEEGGENMGTEVYWTPEP